MLNGVRGACSMVATGHPLAAQAARQILQSGGSAVDAAIAADAVMGVVEPMATSIGGDVMAMLVEPGGRACAYNGSGRASWAFDAQRLDALGGRIPERHALSVTTPGAVRGWHDLHQRYGRCDWSMLLRPAIAAAAEGFAVAPVAAREWALFDRVLHQDPVCARLYRAGSPPVAGERYVNPELAAVLQEIADSGPQAYYQGRVAEAASRAVTAAGGCLTPADFERHQGEFVAPLQASFRGLTVLECPPNSHGVGVLRALEEMEGMPLDPQDPHTMVDVVAAMARGLDHARKTVRDPAGNTVCTVVVDGHGLAVTLMSSIFKRFGSALAVPGCGFVLQNRGFGFSEPGHPNGPAPGKRPFHTVVPAAALRHGRFDAAWGVVGGAMQPQGHVQLLLRIAAWGEPLQAAIDAPRWRLEGGRTLAIEAGMPEPVQAALRQAGYVDPGLAGELGGRSDFGGAQFVRLDEQGLLWGGSDRRKDGLAIGD